MNWNDFNGADDQESFDLIPAKTLAKVRMIIKPGEHDDATQGWLGGWATRNHTSSAIYLNYEFVVLEGKYARRKIWNFIGLHSEKGPNWANIGRAFIKAILNSARGVSDKDNSLTAQNARRINGLGDLDGIEFVARIDIEKNQNGDDKNVIKLAITPDHKDYAALMGLILGAASLPQASNNSPASANSTSDLPSWAQ